MKIQTLSTINDSKIKCLISGMSGAGKTTQALKLKEAGFNVLVVSAEAGLMTIQGTGIDFIDITKDDKDATIPKEKRLARLGEVYAYLQTEEGKKKYDLVFIDSITELSQCIFDLCKIDFPDKAQTLPLYGEIGRKSRDLIKSFRDMPHYHVVFTCLTKIEKDENARRYAAFDLIGSISDKLPQFFDEVIYIKVGDDGTREFICNSTSNIIAKDRSGRLLPIELPDLGKLFRKILTTTEENKNVISESK